MKTIISRTAALIFIVFGGYTEISGQQQPDSLIQYLEIAAQNNPQILQRFNEYKAALQRVPQVGSLPDPEISIGFFLSPMELVSGSQVADIRLMQMFPWFGVLKNAKDEMNLMAEAKYESLRDAKLQVFYNVKRSWFELCKVRKVIQISEKNIGILQTIERLTLTKFKAVSSGTGNTSPSGSNMPTGGSQDNPGDASGMNNMGNVSGNMQYSTGSNRSERMSGNQMSIQTGGTGLADLYRIQIEIGELENNITLLSDQQKTITARLNSYLNRPVNTIVLTPDTLLCDTLGISILNISDTILTRNPMLTMLRCEQQSFDARKKMISSMGYPMVGIGIDYSLINKSDMSSSAMNGKDMIMPMITVTLPVYRKKYKAMQTEADLMKSATEQGYNATANSLQAEYYEAWQSYRDSERRMKLYTSQSKLAQKSLDIMLKSYSVSSISLTDILQIRQQLLEYEIKEAEALTDYNISIAWLNRLMANNRNQ